MQEFKKIPSSKISLAKRKPIYGVGINDAKYNVYYKENGIVSRCAAYVSWCSMLKRCYSKKDLELFPTYKGCSVSNDWILFSNFDKWHSENYVNGYDLDKDIKIIGNKIYSKESCMYVHQSINKLLVDCQASRGDLPIGVSFDKSRNKFSAKVNENARTKNLGRFNTPEEAHHAYKVAKNEQIRMAMKDNPDIACYLEQHLYPLD